MVYATGAAGFYALSYTVMVFPIVFVFAPRLWSIAREHGYITPADFIRGRYGSPGLGLAVAATGILATMPYIALQLIGIKAVLIVLGIGGSSGNGFVDDLPLIIAFLVLAAYTYLAGLRAPALIAFVKDTLIYVTVIVAIPLHPDPAGRLEPHLQRRWHAPQADQPAHRQAEGLTAPILGQVIYIAVAAFIINLAVTIVLTLIFRRVRLPAGTDETEPTQYDADPQREVVAPATMGTGPSDRFGLLSRS